MTASKIFLFFCLSFIAGILLSSIISKLSFLAPYLFMGAGLILGIILIFILWRYKKVALIGFCLLFLVLGVLRHQRAEFRIKNNELRKYNDSEKTITLKGIVREEPDIRTNSMQLTVEVKRGERVLVTTQRYPGYQYGDGLEIRGKLETPPVFEDFNYKNYLAKNGIYSAMRWPEIELLSRKNYTGPSRIIYAKILDFKDKLRESIYQNLSPPQSSILGAMILGDKSRMSNNLKEKLNISGIRHITAVSGMHIVILSGILMSLLIGLGFHRGRAFYFSIVIIFLFIIMTGFQPSGIRAGIMGGLFLLGQKIGRKSISSRAIVMAATLILVVNPLLLVNDVGFQLSFLAVMGIIYLAPTFKNLLKFIPKKLTNLKEIISMTFAAQVFTLPILVYNFGRISLVAPLTNILILPTVYWIMLFGFIFCLVAVIFEPLGWIFSLPCLFLLTYLTKIVDLFSGPRAAKTIENVHWFWLIISYLILAYLSFWLNKKERLKFLHY